MSDAAQQQTRSRVVDRWEAFLAALEDLAADDSLTALLLAYVALDELSTEFVPQLVMRCREEGATWEDVGMATGSSKSGAHQKWRALDQERLAAAGG